MSINWVMLSDKPHSFIYLPNERLLYTSPARTSFSLSSSSQYPASAPFSLSSSAGVAYITNQRIIYIPTSPTKDLKSFSSPIHHLHDTHVSAPFFGPNVWTAVVQPNENGGIPQSNSSIELKLVFKDGGAFDFHNVFERLKERYIQARENARRDENGQVESSQVHLDELPAYDEPAGTMAVEDVAIQETMGAGTSPPPLGPPPGYEEAQMQGLASGLQKQMGVH